MGFAFQWEKKVNKETNKKSEIYGISDSDKCYGEKNVLGKAVQEWWEKRCDFQEWFLVKQKDLGTPAR